MQTLNAKTILLNALKHSADTTMTGRLKLMHAIRYLENPELYEAQPRKRVRVHSARTARTQQRIKVNGRKPGTSGRNFRYAEVV